MTALAGTSITCAAAKQRGRELVSDCPAVFTSSSKGKATIAEQLDAAGWRASKVRGGVIWRCPIHVKHKPEGLVLESLARAAEVAKDRQPSLAGLEATNADDHRVAISSKAKAHR